MLVSKMGVVDVIFFIYLYQRWLYPVDAKRVNAYGVSGEDLDGQSGAKPSEETPASVEASKKQD